VNTMVHVANLDRPSGLAIHYNISSYQRGVLMGDNTPHLYVYDTVPSNGDVEACRYFVQWNSGPCAE